MTAPIENSGAPVIGKKIAAEEAHRLTLPLAPSLERRRLQVHAILMIYDVVGIIGAFFSVSLTLSAKADHNILINFSIIFIPFYILFALYLKVYSIKSITNLRFSQERVIYSLFGTISALTFMAYLVRSPIEIGRISMGFNVLAATLVLAGGRSIIRPLALHLCGPTAQNVLVIDDGGVPVRVPGAWTIRAQDHKMRPDMCDPHMLDRLGMLMTNMDRVLVTCPHDRRAAWALIFKGSNVCGEIVDHDVSNLGVIGAQRSHGFGTLMVSIGPLTLQERAIKRAMDLVLAGVATLFLLPLLLVVSLLIWLDDGGPVFFLQQRQGRNNRLFWIYKFRSMRVNQLDLAGTRSASRADDRVTRVGRFIRKTSIDELPQIINVLRGEMSLVGPRPHAIGSLAGNKRFWEVDPRYLLRHSLKPGLTGLAQVRGLRGATDTETDLTERLQADLEYLNGWTVLRDVWLILATVKVLIHSRAF